MDVSITKQSKLLPQEAFARKLAGHLEDADCKDCGDATFKVVPVGQSAFVSRPAS